MDEKKIDVEQAEELLKNGKSILETIVRETYIRDKGISSEEFKERIGFKDSPLSEEECIRVGLGNIIVEKTLMLLKLRDILKYNVELLQELKRLKEKRDGREEEK